MLLTLALPYVTNYITAQHFHASLLQDLATFIVYHHSCPIYLLVCFTYYSRDWILFPFFSSLAASFMGFPYTNAADFDLTTPSKLILHLLLLSFSPSCLAQFVCLLIPVALHHFFVFMPVKSLICDTCVVRESLVCIWLLDGRCSNLYGPDASLTASPTSSQHPCEQGRLALICVAYWRLPTRCQHPQCLHNLHCSVSRWPPPPQPSLRRWDTRQPNFPVSPARGTHALRHLPSP